jgi:hypothetical protein
MLPRELTRWSPSSAAASKHVATKSVLNPLLWLSAIITPACVIAALFATGVLLYALIVLAFLGPVSAILAFGGFAVLNADRLQSEEYLLQQQWVAAQIGDNASKEVITLEGETAAPAANTAMIGDSSGE